MMEIIFRARRKDNGEWIEGNYIHSTIEKVSHIISEKSSNLFHFIYRDSLQLKNSIGEWEDI